MLIQLQTVFSLSFQWVVSFIFLLDVQAQIGQMILDVLGGRMTLIALDYSRVRQEESE